MQRSWYVADGHFDRNYDSDFQGRVGAHRAAGPELENGNSSQQIERVLLLRGVVWQGKDVDALTLWQDLMRFWPTAFAKQHTSPPAVLLAHSGRHFVTFLTLRARCVMPGPEGLSSSLVSIAVPWSLPGSESQSLSMMGNFVKM